MNSSLHYSTTPSHLVGFRRFGSHPLSYQSRSQARTPLLALLIGLSRSSVHQQNVWRFSYIPPSTTTCFHPQTNTVSDQDTPPLLLCYNCRVISRQVSTKGNLTAAFDTVNHNVLLSKIVRSTLPDATCQWLSNYIRDRQSVTSCICVKSKARILHTGVPQGSKIAPTLLSFYLADMPRPTEPVKLICYPDDITVLTSRVKIPELEHMITGYLKAMSYFLQDNSLLISAPKSTVTLFTPDPMQANTEPKIKMSDAELPQLATQSY